MATILHIEDDPQSQLLVRKLLSAAGHRVLEATSGLEGARLASLQPPDLVLVDINIPDLDGYEVALLLRGRIPEVPVVAITAEGDRGTARAVGCAGFIEKPIDVGSFARTLESYLVGSPALSTPPEGSDAGVLRAQGERIAAHLEAKATALTDAEARLEEADALRKQFYRNVSHELATPLTPLVGYLGLLRREELGPVNAPQRKALGAMDDALGRLRAAIEDLLDVTQLETGRMRFALSPCDLGDVLRKAIESRQARLKAAGVSLVAELPSDAVAARADAERVARAVGHLLDNAAKFAGSPGTVAIELRPGPTHVEVLVADSGEGVAPAWLGRIFEPFVQADGSPTRRHGGAGVGLAVVRGVAEAHDGVATAENGGRTRVAGQSLTGLLVRLKLARNPAPREG